jgi:hypothetical protein
MSRRHQLKRYQVITDQDSTTSDRSTETDISALDRIFYQIEIDALVDCEIEVKVCNDDKFSVANSFSLDFEQTLALIGATDTQYNIVIENKGFKWMFIDVTNNGGTGNINAWVTGNNLGA